MIDLQKIFRRLNTLVLLILSTHGLSSVAGFASVLLCSHALAFSVLYMEFGDLVDESDRIFDGEVTAIQSRLEANKGILSDVTFDKCTYIKGSGTERNVLTLAGGTIGDISVVIAGAPKFTIGKRYIVFDEGNGRNFFPVLGGGQGIYEVKTNAATGEPLVYDYMGSTIAHASVQQAMTGSGEQTLGSNASVRLGDFVGAIKARLGH